MAAWIWVVATLGIILALILCIVLGVYIFYRVTTTTCHCDVDMTGKTVVITGANAGIGYETAKALAQKGAKVIMGCRNMERATAAADRLRNEVDQGEIIVRQLDVSKLSSVREFAKVMIESEERLDVLINNAGVAGFNVDDLFAVLEKAGVETRNFHTILGIVRDKTQPNAKRMDKEVTEDGLDLTFATNHYGHFLLTNLLLGLLKESAPSRVINVSSVWYKKGNINIQKLQQPETTYRYLQVYADSKLANVLFSRELAKRTKEIGISAFSLHPGSVETNILNSHLNCVTRLGYRLLASFSHKTPEQGAQTSIHCAIAPGIEIQSGNYFNECKVEMLVRRGQNDVKAKQFWELSERLTGLVREPVKEEKKRIEEV